MYMPGMAFAIIKQKKILWASSSENFEHPFRPETKKEEPKYPVGAWVGANNPQINPFNPLFFCFDSLITIQKNQNNSKHRSYPLFTKCIFRKMRILVADCRNRIGKHLLIDPF